ncbi:MAG TPA: HAD family hydrolase [Rhodopila sp.]|nr:HAD family hydrolase [Rhodopila sp.]
MISLLILDLDGVVVYDAQPPYVEAAELILLHAVLDDALQRLGIPVVVLTHRSRAEAAVILRSARLEHEVAGVMAAEDILRAALAYGTLWQLVRKGLRKSWALPAIEHRYGVNRGSVAFIDDRLDNIEDLVDGGVGLAMHAPSGITNDGGLIGFDFDQAVRIISEWHPGQTERIVRIAPRIIDNGAWVRTGVSATAHAGGMFNRVRRYGRRSRRLLMDRS